MARLTLARARRVRTRSETGFVAQRVVPQLWERTFDSHHEGQFMRLHERYFLIRAARFEPAAAGHERAEQRFFRGFRWWPVAALTHDESVDSGQTLQTVIAQAL